MNIGEAAKNLIEMVEKQRQYYKDKSGRPFNFVCPMSDSPEALEAITQVIDHYTAQGWAHVILRYFDEDTKPCWLLMLCEQAWFMSNLFVNHPPVNKE